MYIPKEKTKNTEGTNMTRFEKDVKEIMEGNSIEVMMRRKAELEEIYRKGRCERNGFRLQCLLQDYRRLRAEYEKLDDMI